MFLNCENLDNPFNATAPVNSAKAISVAILVVSPIIPAIENSSPSFAFPKFDICA